MWRRAGGKGQHAIGATVTVGLTGFGHACGQHALARPHILDLERTELVHVAPARPGGGDEAEDRVVVVE